MSDDDRAVTEEADVASEACEAEPSGRPPARHSGGWRSWLARVHPRMLVRGAFFAFFVYASVKLWLFYLWAIGAGAYVPRPEAVAGIIPVGAYMSFFAWIKSGIYDPVIPAGVTIIVGALLTSLLLKRAFCGWICPVGAFWEFFGWAGKRVLPKQPRAPRPVDLALRGLRYAFTALLMFWLLSLPVEVALNFQTIPYYAVADIKILSYFVHPPLWYLGLGAAIAAASFAFGNVWCRYICPLGGLYGAVGVASPCTVVRDDDLCTQCGRCNKVCHAMVDVRASGSVHAPECDGCQECVRACPEPGALEGRVLRRWVMNPWLWAALAVGLWLVVWGVALATGHWTSPLTPEQFREAVRSVAI